jgi:SAM-dependent methyltransferase
MNATTLKLTEPVEQVRAFWNTEACGTHFVTRFADDRDFFRKYRDFRYRTEWHIPAFARFADGAERQVLEIGCGNGADGAMFAMQGARYTGVDLTAEAVEATRRHFAAEGLDGTFRQQNCERLSFADRTFDIVYSFGVLHHTPAMQQAIDEVHRVLKPGGVARVMLYHRRSFNYHVRILFWMRLKVMLGALRRIRHWRSDCDQLARAELAGVRGNTAREVWEIHYRNFLREGWDYFKPANFVHRCTDGPECPCAYTCTASEARQLFARFRTVRTRVAHLPLNKYPGARWLPRWVEGCAARLFGWHLLIEATK